MAGINETALKFDWWEMPESEKGPYLPLPTRDELALAFKIASLRTASEPNGLLVNGTNGTEKRCCTCLGCSPAKPSRRSIFVANTMLGGMATSF
jgi:hypothetical protein